MVNKKYLAIGLIIGIGLSSIIIFAWIIPSISMNQKKANENKMLLKFLMQPLYEGEYTLNVVSDVVFTGSFCGMSIGPALGCNCYLSTFDDGYINISISAVGSCNYTFSFNGKVVQSGELNFPGYSYYWHDNTGLDEWLIMFVFL